MKKKYKQAKTLRDFLIKGTEKIGKTWVLNECEAISLPLCIYAKET